MFQCPTLATTAVFLVHCYILTSTDASNDDCGVIINRQDDNVNKNGSIQSPPYAPNLRCLYFLIGKRNERVQIYFKEFDVKGVLPRCLDDYVDVYTQVRNHDENLLNVPLHGRYCGSDKEKLPRLFISMTNILVVGFYTMSSGDGDDESPKGFKAKYRFIDDSVYNVGTPAPDTCGQTINSVQSGVLLSPTYPGMYPDHIFCFYKINGSPGQRIRLTFTEIDLYSGGDHCPFDYIKVFDGRDNEAEVIDTYCGRRTDNVTIYSTEHHLNIIFETKSGRAEATKTSYLTYDKKLEPELQRRGFRAEFEISDSFVNLGITTSPLPPSRIVIN